MAPLILSDYELSRFEWQQTRVAWQIKRLVDKDKPNSLGFFFRVPGQRC